MTASNNAEFPSSLHSVISHTAPSTHISRMARSESDYVTKVGGYQRPYPIQGRLLIAVCDVDQPYRGWSG